jgi:hypothetical protein
MNNSKIQVKVGIVEFSGEGDQEWLALQLDKIISKVPELLRLELESPTIKDETTEVGKLKNPPATVTSKPMNLSSWLKEKNATINLVKKFLATAAFLQVGGKSRLSTAEIVTALKNSNQSKLANPADNLNANVKKGFCEKDGNEFFVTVEGLEELSIT